MNPPTSKKQIVTLCPYKKVLHGELNSYFLPDNQKKLTAMPSEALAACEQDKNRMPFVIKVEHDIVGFFVLHHGSNIVSYSSRPKAVLLRAFSIDYHYQGRGIAKEAMTQLNAFVREILPFANEIVLAVNFENPNAKRLYEQVGFTQIDVRKGGESFQYLMHLEI